VRVVWHEGRAEVLTVTWPDAAGDWSVRHVWADLGFASTVSFTGVDTVALACDSERCLLLGADEDETTLVPLPGTELPADADVDRLAFRDEAALCAYGAQLYCLGEGGWTLATSVPVGAGTRFTHVLPSPPAPEPDTIPVIGAAATDTGAVLVELQPGNWTLARPASSASGAVVALEGKYELVSVVFESGLWLGDLVGQSLLPCERNGLAWFAPIRPEVDTWVGATESGDVFLHEHERGTGNISWCGLDRDLEADILGLSLRTCGIANGILVLTPTRLTSLFGEPHCAVD